MSDHHDNGARPHDPFPDDPAHDEAVDGLLDAFPGAKVIAAWKYDERRRALRYDAARKNRKDRKR